MDECTEAAVLDCLLKAVSQEQQQAMLATEILAALGKRLEYFRILAQIFPMTEIPHDARLLALIQLKQFVHSRWLASRAAPDPAFPLTADERAWFRHQFLSQVCIEDSALAQQLSVVVGKVARADWPDLWPDLLPGLLAAADAGSSSPLLVLLHVVKSLASRRLPAHRQLFSRFAAELAPALVGRTWAAARAVEAALVGGGGGGLERLRLLVSVLRCLVEFGFRDSSAGDVDGLVELALHLPAMLVGGEDRLAVTGQLPAAEKTLVKASHLLLALHAALPRSFIPHIPAATGAVLSLTLDARPSPLLSQAAVRNFLNLLHALLTCPRYRARIQSGEGALEATRAREALRAAILPRLEELLRHLVVVRLPLSEAEVLAAVGDFEEHVFPQETDQEWRFDLRACVGSLLLLLLTEFDDEAPPVLLGVVKAGCEEVGEMAGLRTREACCGALGLVAAWLANDIPPDQVVSLLVLPGLASHADGGTTEQQAHDLVLRRRLLWLIGEVADDSLPPPLIAQTLAAVWEFLSARHAPLLRLQAARSLAKLLGVLDECEPAAVDPPLLAGLPQAMDDLLSLLGQLRETATRIKLLHVVRAAVSSLRGSQARQAALHALLPGLPAFWAAARDEETLLRAAVLELFAETAETLGGEATLLLPLAAALLPAALPEDAEDDRLAEPGLALLHALVKNARLLDLPAEDKAPLVDLFPRLLPLLERCNDLTLVALHVSDGLCIVAGPLLMQAHAVALADALTGVVQLAEPSLADSALLVAETVVKMFPGDAVPLLHRLGRLLIDALLSSNLPDPELRPNHVRLLARLLLADQPQLQALLLAHAGPERASAAVSLLLAKVHLNLIHWSSARLRKLMAMALGLILAAFGPALPEVAARLDEIVDALFAAIRELEGEGRTVTDAASCVSNDETAPPDLPRAKRTVFRADPVLGELRRWTGESVAKYRLGVGEEAFQAQMDALDPVMRQQVFMLLGQA